MIKKVKDIGWKEFQGETIVADFKKSNYFALNETASFIWKKVNGKNNEKKIAASLAKEYNLPQKKVLSDTKKTIKKLFSFKLIRN